MRKSLNTAAEGAATVSKKKYSCENRYRSFAFICLLTSLFSVAPISSAIAYDYVSAEPPPDNLIISWITDAKICAAAIVGATFFPAESIFGLADLGNGKYQVTYTISGGRIMDNVFMTRLNTNLWKISCSSTVRGTKTGVIQEFN